MIRLAGDLACKKAIKNSQQLTYRLTFEGWMLIKGLDLTCVLIFKVFLKAEIGFGP